MKTLQDTHHASVSARRWRWLGPLAVAAVAAVAAGAAYAGVRSEQKASALDAVSKESAQAVSDMRSARIAIFEGQTDLAKRYLDDATKLLEEADAHAPRTEVTVQTKRTVGGDEVTKSEREEVTDLVPVDAWVGVSEDFVARPKLRASEDEAAKDATASDAAPSVEAEDIGITVTRVLMPVHRTAAHVERAKKLLGQDKFYEANLALRAAEDELVTDEIVLYQPVHAIHAEADSAR